MILRMVRILSLFLAISAFGFAAQAGDEGLYDPVPPEGSSFVRFINTDATPAPAKINGKAYDQAEPGSVTPFVYLPATNGNITLGEGSASQQLEPGKHYAAVLQGGKVTVQEDPYAIDKIKAQLVVFNLTTKADVSLKTADGKTEVVGPLAKSASSARNVNAIKAGFTVYAGDEKIADVPEKALERGESYVIAVYEGADGKIATDYEKAEIAPSK